MINPHAVEDFYAHRKLVLERIKAALKRENEQKKRK